MSLNPAPSCSLESQRITSILDDMDESLTCASVRTWLCRIERSSQVPSLGGRERTRKIQCKNNPMAAETLVLDEGMGRKDTHFCNLLTPKTCYQSRDFACAGSTFSNNRLDIVAQHFVQVHSSHDIQGMSHGIRLFLVWSRGQSHQVFHSRAKQNLQANKGLQSSHGNQERCKMPSSRCFWPPTIQIIQCLHKVSKLP